MSTNLKRGHAQTTVGNESVSSLQSLPIAIMVKPQDRCLHLRKLPKTTSRCRHLSLTRCPDLCPRCRVQVNLTIDTLILWFLQEIHLQAVRKILSNNLWFRSKTNNAKITSLSTTMGLWVYQGQATRNFLKLSMPQWTKWDKWSTTCLEFSHTLSIQAAARNCRTII